jgi:hypothetical protein
MSCLTLPYCEYQDGQLKLNLQPSTGYKWRARIVAIYDWETKEGCVNEGDSYYETPWKPPNVLNPEWNTFSTPP